MKIIVVAGARPNFMKIAPLVRELKAKSRELRTESQEPRAKSYELKYKIIHTGQHYDYEMSKVFFKDLDIPEPDYFLGVGSGSHAEQTAKIMVEFEKICMTEKPDIVVVVGDVNSTLACSVTAKKLNIRVAHVEAGLRSKDMTMPEEINRIVTDSISDYLFVSERSGVDNLKSEGKGDDQVFFVGNIMIDTLYYCLNKLNNQNKAKNKEQRAKSHNQFRMPYAVLTLHRPSNVDARGTLRGILEAIAEISKDRPIYFPLHPRTKKNINKFKLSSLLKASNIKVSSPLSYLEFLALWKDAALVLTDSGGIQEETTALGIPCFTIRDNTERPITIEEGTNTLVGTKKETILNAYSKFKKGNSKKGRIPVFWDGNTAKRIVDILLKEYEAR